MYLKLVKIVVVFISIALVSPLIKYQPDIRMKQEIVTRQESTGAADADDSLKFRAKISEETVRNTETETLSVIEESTEEIKASESCETKERESSSAVQSEATLKRETEAFPETDFSEITSTMITESEESIVESAAPTAGTEEEAVTAAPAIPYEATAPTETVHSHTWVPITEIIHHEAVYETIHHPEVTETIWVEDAPAYDEVYEDKRLVGIHDYCKGCGIDLTTSGMSFEEYQEHERQHLLNGDDASYYSAPVYENVTQTIHHEADGHYEDRVVQEAYDETIPKAEAWDEEMIKGYRCSECGAVQ